MVQFFLESTEMYTRYRIWPRVNWVCVRIDFDMEFLMWIHTKSTIEHFLVLFENFQQVRLLLGIEVS